MESRLRASNKTTSDTSSCFVSLQAQELQLGGRLSFRKFRSSSVLAVTVCIALLVAVTICWSESLCTSGVFKRSVNPSLPRRYGQVSSASLFPFWEHENRFPLFREGEKMSVEHYMIPGEIPSGVNNTQGASVVLHLFVKCLVHTADVDVLCAGFGFAESTAGNVSTVHRHLNQPPEFDLWEPHIEIRNGVGQPVNASMNVSMAPTGHMERLPPFHFQGLLPLSLRDTVPEIHVDNWPRAQPFHNFENLEEPTLVTQPPKTYFLISAFYYEPPRGSYELAAQLLVHHVRHHVAMGFAGDIMYVQRHYPEKLLQNEELKEFVRKGQLQLIVWDAFPRYWNRRLPHIDQHLQYNHGLLEQFGRGVRVLLGDVDEYFVTDKPRDVTEALTQVGWPDQGHVKRYDVMCSGPICPGDGTNELPVWWSPAKHPLRHYSLMDKDGFSSKDGKVVVNPDKMLHHFVHFGIVPPGGLDVTVPPEVAFIVHPRSLYKKRTNKTDCHTETSWHWLFETVQ